MPARSLLAIWKGFSTAEKIILAAMGFGLVLGLLSLISSGGPGAVAPEPASRTDEERLAEQKQKDEDSAKDVRTLQATRAIHHAMREPDSLKLESVLYMDSGAVCIEYRGRNGFGGMNIEHGLETPRGKLLVGDFADFAAEWNRYCSGKNGEDKTAEATAFLKYGPQ